MLVAGVVQHQVEEKTHAPCVCFFQEPVEILHRAEVRHDLPVIADVVAVVGVGRGEDRIEPQGFDSLPMQVVEFSVIPFRSPIPSSLLSLKLRG